MKQVEKWKIVLLSLYAEAIHCGTFAEVTAKTMEMDGGEFGWTLYILQMRGYISGCRFQPPKPSPKGRLMGVLRDELLLTPTGFQAAEAMVKECEKDDARIHRVWTMLRDVGCGIMANIVYEWLK